MNTKIADYKVIAHGSVFLLMAQNEAASLNLEDFYQDSKKRGLTNPLISSIIVYIDNFTR